MRGTRNKSTREFLELLLEKIKKARPCNVSHFNTVVFWEMRERMNALDKSQDHSRKCAAISGNALLRIRDAYIHHNPDTPLHDVYGEVAHLNIDEYISLVEAAILLPKEVCRDGSTNKNN